MVEGNVSKNPSVLHNNSKAIAVPGLLKSANCRS